MLHASGKFVPCLIEHFASKNLLTNDQIDVLTNQQKLVLASMAKDKDEEHEKDISAKLEASTPGVKTLVISLKKSNSSE